MLNFGEATEASGRLFGQQAAGLFVERERAGLQGEQHEIGQFQRGLGAVLDQRNGR